MPSSNELILYNILSNKDSSRVCYLSNKPNSNLQCQFSKHLDIQSRQVFYIMFYECHEVLSENKLSEKTKLLTQYIIRTIKASIKNAPNSNPFFKWYNTFTKTPLYYQRYLLLCANIVKQCPNNRIIFIPLPYNSYALNLSFYGLNIRNLI